MHWIGMKNDVKKYVEQYVRIQLAYFTISPLQWQKTEVALCHLYLYIAKMSTEKHKDSRKQGIIKTNPASSRERLDILLG